MNQLSKFLSLFVFLFVINNAQSQSISIVRFNNTATYFPGAGISVHITPTGIFDLNNQFVLELSSATGSFASPTTITTVNEFFVPVLNGTLPSSIAAGTGYKLRVRATTLNVTPVVTDAFIIQSSTTFLKPTISLTTQPTVSCLSNNFFGWLDKSSNSTTALFYFTIDQFDQSLTYNVRLINSFNNTVSDLAPPDPGLYVIPSGFPLNYYTIEVEKKSNGVSSVNTYTYLFHTTGTGLNNLSPENVCTGSEVKFKVQGISANYPGSRYSIHYGDVISTASTIYTHAQLLANDTLGHVFSNPTCASSFKKLDQSSGKYFYEVNFYLYNKGLKANNVANCTGFLQNGNGVQKLVNASTPPEANFAANKICLGSVLNATNQTIAGQYGSGASCLNSVIYSWYYKKPSSNTYLPVNPIYVSANGNLSLPASIVNEKGCWSLMLEAANPEGCTQASSVTKSVSVEVMPTPDFNITKNGIVVSQICKDQIVDLIDNSNTSGVACTPPSYSWSISPNSGYNTTNGTTLSSQNPSIQFTAAGNYTITQSITNSCGTRTAQKTLTVSGDPTVTLMSSVTICTKSPVDTTIDFSTAPFKPTYSTAPSNPSSYSWTVSGPGVTTADYTFVTAANVDFPKIKFLAAKDFTVSVHVNGNCAGSNDASITIKVKQKPDLTLSINPNSTSICQGSTPVLTATAAAGGSVFSTYSWMQNTTTLSATGTTYTLPNTLAVGTYKYKATVTDVAGCTASDSLNITVKQVPSANSISAVSYCNGAPTTAISFSGTPASGVIYNWTNSNTAIGLTSGTGSGTISSFTATNAGTSPISSTISVTPELNGCYGTAKNFTITVNPTPTVDALPNATYCAGDVGAAINFSSAVASTTFNWTAGAGVGFGTSGTTNISSYTATNSTANPVTATITVTPKANNCIGANGSFTITVNPIPQLSSTLTPAAVCSGSSFTYTPTSATSGTTFTWTRAIVSGINNPAVTNGTGGISETLVNNTNAAINVIYVYTLSANGCSNTQNVTVSVKPIPALSSSLTSSICSGNLFSYTATSATSGTAFSWTRATVAGISNTAGGGNTAAISETLTNTTSADIIVNYVFSLNANGCSNSQTLALTVKPSPTLSSGTPAAICSNTLFTYTPTSGTAGTTFSWARALVSGISNPAGSGVNDISETLINTTVNPVTVNYVYTLTANGCSRPQTVSVVVNPTPKLSSSLTPAAVCSGSNFSYTATSTTAGTSFSWTRATVGGISNAAGSGNASISETLTNTTDAPITVNYVFNLSANGCTNAQTVTLVVNPKPSVDAISDKSFCNGTASGAINFSGPVSGTTFTWSNTNTVIGLGASGSGNSISFTATNSGTASISGTITITPSANGCTGTPGSFAITVKPSPKLSSTLTPPSICTNSAFTYTHTSATFGTLFSWTRAAVTGISNAAATGTDNINEVLINTTAQPITVNYSYTLTASGCTNPQNVAVVVNPIPALSSSLLGNVCSGNVYNYTATSATTGATFSWTRALTTGISNPAGSGSTTISETLINTTTAPVDVIYVFTISAGGCSRQQSLVVTVNPSPALSSLLSNSAICSGVAFAYTPTSATSGTTFSWARALVSGISNPASSGNGDISETLINTTASPIVVNYSYTLTANGCSRPQTVSVTINPKPVLSSPLAATAVCSNSAFNYIPTSATTGTNFSWTRSTVTGISNAAGSGNGTVSETLLNTTTSPITVTYVFSLMANGCSNSQNVTVTVKPTPDVNALLDKVFCNGEGSGSIAFSGAVSGATFSWSNNNTAIGLGTSGSGFISFTAANSGSSPLTATITVTPSASGCAGAPTSFLITVNPGPTLSSATNANVCSGSAFSYTPTSSSSGASFSWSRSSVLGISNGAATGNGPIAETLNNTTTAPVTVTYVFTLNAGGCSGTQNLTVTVQPKPVLSSTLNPSAVCSNTSFSYTPTSATLGVTFSWSRAGVAGISNAANTGSGTINETLVNTTTAPVAVTYTFTITVNGCSNTQNVTVIVNSVPALSSATSDIVCSNSLYTYTPSSATTGTVYAWSRVAVVGISNPSATGNGAISETLINTTANAINVLYTYTLNANGCSRNQSLMVTVNPSPSLVNLAPIQVCSGNALAYTPASNTSGATYAWSRAAVTGISNAPATGNGMITETLVNTTTSPVTVAYVYTVSANGCSRQQTLTVTVNPGPVLNSSANPAAICSGNAFAYIPTSATSGSSFAWTRASVPGISNAAGSGNGSINEILVNTTPSSIVVGYVYTVSANGCSSSQTVSVTVNPSPSLSSPLTTAPICSNASFIYTPSSTTSSTTFSWSREATNGISNAAATGSGAINETLINTTNATINVIYTYSLSANGCTTSQAVTVPVKPVPTLSSTLLPNGVCTGTSFSYTPTSSSAGLTYTWGRNAVAGISNPASSGTDAIAETLINTSAVPVTVTYVYTLAGNGCTNNQSVKVTIYPIPDVATVPDQILCNGSPSGTIGFSSSISGTAFSWINSNASIGLPGSGTGSISFSALNASSSPVNATITVTPTIGTCAGPSTSFAITVKPTPTLSSPINLPGICTGEMFSYTPSSAIAGTSFSWSRAAINGISNAASTGTGAISETLVNTTNAPILVSYNYTLSVNGCAGVQTISVLVNPKPLIQQAATQSYCSGVATGGVIFNSNVNGVTYTWTNSNPAIGLGASGSGNLPSFTPTNNTSSPISATITVTASLNGCVSNAMTFIILVSPTPNVNPVPSVSYCNGETVAPINFTGSSQLYTWVNNTPGIGLPISGIGNIASFTATNNTTSVLTATIVVTPLQNGCSGNSIAFDISVNPGPKLSSSLTPAAVCSGSSFAYTPTSATTGVTFSWSRAAVAGITNAASSGIGSISETLINATTVPITVSYVYTISANGCAGSEVVRVVINPTPSVNPVADQVYCNGASSGGLSFTGPVSGTTYSWTNSNTAIGLATSGSGGISFTATNSGIAPITATINVTPVANGCAGTAVSFAITVKPGPKLSSSVSTTTCTNTIFNYTPTSATTSVLFTWNRAATSGITNATSSGTGIISETLVNTTLIPIDVTYHYTLSGNGCTGEQDVVVTVYPKPQLSSALTAAACTNAAFVYTPTSSANGATFSWTRAAVAGISNPPSSGVGNISETLINTTNTLVDVIYVYTITANGCTAQQAVTVSVGQAPSLSSPLQNTVCSDAVFNYVPTGSIGNLVFTWTRASVSGISNPSASGSGSISETLVNTTTSPITVNYVYTLSSNGCSRTQTVAVLVNPKPIADFSIANPSSCTGVLTSQFNAFPSATSSPLTAWNWSFGDGTVATSSFPSHTYNQPGRYSVTLKVTDANGCQSLQQAKSVVNFGKAKANFQVSPICLGTSASPIQLSTPGFGSTGIDYSQWNFGDGTILTGSAPSHTYVAEGDYLVTLIVKSDSSCIYDTVQKSITVYGKPKADFTFANNCLGSPVQFTNTSTPGFGETSLVSFRWAFGDNVGSNTINASHAYTAANTYTVSLIARGTFCPLLTDTIKKSVVINKGRSGIDYPRINAAKSQPVQLKAQGGGVSYQWTPALGLSSTTNQNPVGKYSANDPNSILYSIKIIDSSGCVVTDRQLVWLFSGSDIFLPSAFTPNSDGANDVFKPVYVNIKSIKNFRIFDRWGKVIFETSDMNQSWNGTLGGKPMAMDTYSWVIVGVDEQGKETFKKGNVTLIRD